MSAIDPWIRRTAGVDTLLRQGTRLAAVAFYVTALVVALILARPAFRDTPAPVLEPAAVQVPTTDKVRNSLALRPGTKLRIR